MAETLLTIASLRPSLDWKEHIVERACFRRAEMLRYLYQVEDRAWEQSKRRSNAATPDSLRESWVVPWLEAVYSRGWCTAEDITKTWLIEENLKNVFARISSEVKQEIAKSARRPEFDDLSRVQMSVELWWAEHVAYGGVERRQKERVDKLVDILSECLVISRNRIPSPQSPERDYAEGFSNAISAMAEDLRSGSFNEAIPARRAAAFDTRGDSHKDGFTAGWHYALLLIKASVNEKI